MERYATLGQAVLDEEYDRLCKGLEYRTLKFNEKFDAAERKVSDAFQKQVDDLLTKLEGRSTFQIVLFFPDDLQKVGFFFYYLQKIRNWQGTHSKSWIRQLRKI